MEPEETRTGEIRRVTRDETLADIGGIAEVAKELGVPAPRLKRWIDRRELHTPPPVKPLRGMRLYSIAAWREWYRMWRTTRERHHETGENEEG